MIKVNFNLRQVKKTGTDSFLNKSQPINMVLRWSGERLVYSTKISVLPKWWDVKKQEIKAVLAEPNYPQLNDNLKALREKAKEVYTGLDATNNKITPELLKKKLDAATGRVETPFSDFWSFLDFFIKEAPKRINPDTGLRLSPRIVQRYNTTHKILQEFQKEEFKNQSITFDALDKTFFDKFREYLTSEIKNCTANTVAKHFETLKSFLYAAESYDVKVNQALKLKGVATATRKETFDIYLNKNDLKKLHDAELTDSLDRARDLLLLSCYTGLRFNDWSQINTASFKDGNMELFQYKTGGKVTIPLKSEVLEIFSKYGGKAPDVISNQKFNDYIKTACERAKITENVQGVVTKSGKRIVERYKKYEMVSSHTGRRSFAINEYIDGMPVQTIMAITGHKSVKTFMAYLKLTPEEHAEVAKKHWKSKNKDGDEIEAATN